MVLPTSRQHLSGEKHGLERRLEVMTNEVASLGTCIKQWFPTGLASITMSARSQEGSNAACNLLHKKAAPPGLFSFRRQTGSCTSAAGPYRCRHAGLRTSCSISGDICSQAGSRRPWSAGVLQAEMVVNNSGAHWITKTCDVQATYMT